MAVITNIEDLRRQAHRKVPRDVMDYYESGSYAEETLAANRADLTAIKLKQKILAGASGRSLETRILGETRSLPIALAPVGLLGLGHRDAEIAAARAAEAANIPFTLSTMSICSIEDVADATTKPFWFQLYIMKDKAFIADLIARARAAKCSALVLTVDLQVLGQRHRDVKSGLTVPPRLRLDTALRMAAKPGWVMSVLAGKRKTFGNLAGRVDGMSGTFTLAQWTQSQFDQALSWKDVEWVKSLWPGKLILKGILDADDARAAVASGADALVVSNHGGRQLDGAPSSISQLPRIAEAVGTGIEVMFDGGIRSGQDVFRALALGAKSCLIGRALAYGVCAGGQAGVTQAIDILRKELDVTMALTGVRTINAIDRSAIVS